MAGTAGCLLRPSTIFGATSPFREDAKQVPFQMLVLGDSIMWGQGLDDAALPEIETEARQDLYAFIRWK